jgi:hypothetical protein
MKITSYLLIHVVKNVQAFNKPEFIILSFHFTVHLIYILESEA